METTISKSLWNFKRLKEHQWFRFVLILLVIVIIAYIISHLSLKFYPNLLREKGYEYDRLTKEQILHVGKIYEADSSRPEYIPTRVWQYVQSEYNGKVEIRQLNEIKAHITGLSSGVAMDYLSKVRLKIASYFWLTGPEVYFEIMFWSLFGVLCSILFNIGNIIRNSTTNPDKARTQFDNSEIYSQVAKMAYAPICTLVIILGYNFFDQGTVADISSSKGVLVFSFIGGFYSSRMMAFLDRLKEVLLPNSGTSEAPPIENLTETALVKNTALNLKIEDTIFPVEIKNAIMKTGLTDATVKLINTSNQETIIITESIPNNNTSLLIKETKKGTYRVVINWEKELNGSMVFLNADTQITIASDNQVFDISLKKSDGNG
jgi:hypothetical protein